MTNPERNELLDLLVKWESKRKYWDKRFSETRDNSYQMLALNYLQISLELRQAMEAMYEHAGN